MNDNIMSHYHIGQTPPPITDGTKAQPGTPQTTMVRNAVAQEQENKEKQQQRLQLYNSLFGQEKDKNNICNKSGLQLTSSLNYSLYTFLHLCDNYWVLAMIDIESLKNIQEKYGIQKSQNKLNQIATVIYNFCQNIPSKLKGFKCDDLINNNNGNNNNNNNIDDHDDDEYNYGYNYNVFCILMYCYPKLILSEKYISKLIKKIKQQTNENVFVGIAKMNDWETFDQWKYRAFKNLQNAKNDKNIKNSKNQNNDSTFFSDIGIEYTNPNQLQDGENQDEKKQERQEKARMTQTATFGNKEEFDVKMKEIANKEDYEWIVAVMAIDDYDSFVFSTNNDKKLISKEINKMEKEIYHLFDIYGSINNQKMKYFGYKLDRVDEFGLIFYDSNDRSKCFVPGHEIIETLQEEVSIKCSFSVSIGCSRLIEDDLGFSDDWYQRAYNNLKQAKKSGPNGICFGINDNEKSKTEETKLDEINVDDTIKAKSLNAIDVC